MITLHDDDDETLPPVVPLRTRHKKNPAAKDNNLVDPPPRSSAEKPQPETVEEENVDQIIYRSRRTGQRITAEEWHKQGSTGKPPTSKKSRLAESQLPHGGGMVQQHLRQAADRHAQEVLAGGFHRSEIQTSLDQELRDKHRAEDPMKDFIGNVESSVGRGAPVKERCKYTAPPNRFGIKAGSKWDGRVRGTGFEEKYLRALQACSESKADTLEEEDD